MAKRAQKGQLIGYNDQHGKIFWIWLLNEKRIVRASTVRFYEGKANQEDDNTEATEEYITEFKDLSVEEASQASTLITIVVNISLYERTYK